MVNESDGRSPHSKFSQPAMPGRHSNGPYTQKSQHGRPAIAPPAERRLISLGQIAHVALQSPTDFANEILVRLRCYFGYPKDVARHQQPNDL